MSAKELAKTQVVKDLYEQVVDTVDQSDLPLFKASSRNWSARSALRDFAQLILELFENILESDEELSDESGSDTFEEEETEESESISEEHSDESEEEEQE